MGQLTNFWVTDRLILLDEDAGVECDDGGFCTGSYDDAIAMACEQAKDLLKIKGVRG